MDEKVSVCIPVYNGSATILETIQSILGQSFQDFELVIVDNASTDNTVELIQSIKDERIKLYRNKENIGGGGNIEECRQKATGDIIFYICADDLADIDALKKVCDAFSISGDIGIVARPYYWFEDDYRKPVRITKQFNENQRVSIGDSYGKIKDVIALANQLSGMGFRKKYMNVPFSRHLFVEIASMVANMLKNCQAIILKDNIIAVRIGSSATKLAYVYQESPLRSWYNLITGTFSEDKFRALRDYLVDDFVANNYIGLVQIKNYGSYKALLREIYYLLKFRRRNIFSPQFWFFALGTMIVPRFLLRRLVVVYKSNFNSRFLRNIEIVRLKK